MNLVDISRELRARTAGLDFGAPVSHSYNPLDYAREPHELYLRRYGSGTREVLLLGMNPGPFGMVQTGVPFGDVNHVRDWMRINARVHRPEPEHPKRPIQGFECGRREVSGSRLWGWARERFGPPERFFERFFVANYCPLAFVEDSGRNRTPDKLPTAERAALFAVCDDALRAVVDCLRPRFVVGIGAFATQRASTALEGFDGVIGTVLHPSPASPLANRGWAPAAERQFRALGVSLPDGAAPR